MSTRLSRIALLVAAFAAVSAGAFGQGAKTSEAAGGVSIDALPRHPIPYKALNTASKPKAKPKRTPAASSPTVPAANPATSTSTGAKVSEPTPATAHPTPAPAPAPAVKLAATQPPNATALSTKAPSTPQPTNAAQPKPPPPAPKPAPSVSAFVAPPPPLPPPQLGSRLQPGQALPAPELEAFIDGQVGRAIVSDHIAGVAVAVVQNGQLVMEKGYGSPSPSPAQRIDPRASLVRLGSASQIFTWIAALKAVEEGKLKLDAPVNDYLPEDLKLPDEGFNRPILVRHLMSHTAGFEDRAFGRRYRLQADALMVLDKALRQLRPRRVRAAGLLSIPSDYGVALAGDVVAKVEGQPFDQLIETEILKPLALSHTSFREPYPAGGDLADPLPLNLANAVATGFHWTGDGFQAQPFAYGQSLSPAIAASTTADDMARLMIALLNNGRMGETALYGPKTATLLRAPLQRPGPGIDGWAHGLAMQRSPGGFEMLNDVGAAPGFHSNLSLAPSLNLGVFIVVNTDTGAALARALPGAIVERFYGAQTKPLPTKSVAAPDLIYSGAYLSADRAYHGLEAFVDRLTLQSALTTDPTGALVLHDADGAQLFHPNSTPNQFQSENGATLFAPILNGKVAAYVRGSGGGAATRVGGAHSLGVLAFWAAACLLTVFASFAGLFIRDRIDPRETRAQAIASATQVITCVVWCLAFAAFYLFTRDGLSTSRLMSDWPNRWLIVASWSALIAAALSLVMMTQLAGVWREERRIHGWPAWRKARHTITVGVFLVFTAVLAAWGALEPWSS